MLLSISQLEMSFYFLDLGLDLTLPLAWRGLMLDNLCNFL